MREIKFRVWNGKEYKYFGNLFYGVNRKGKGCLIFNEESQFEHDKLGIKNIDYKIEQFTGLKDKNGVEIYEGDIVKSTEFLNYKYGGIFYGEVFWNKNYGWNVTGNKHTFLGDFELDKLEVISNIHEKNKVLLK